MSKKLHLQLFLLTFGIYVIILFCIMNYIDRVYGKVTIKEPVVLDIINSPAMQRLKGIDQAGYFSPFYPGTAHTRFEHSIGVYLLLNKYNASIEEQVAGLIHDVSHSTFSHCIDYVLDSGSQKEQTHQDDIFADFVKKTELPATLEKYGLDVDYVLDDSHFPLKEKELPDLCADRIDYSLRAGLIFRDLSEKGANYLLNNLIIKNNIWVFKDFNSARAHAKLFLKINADYFSGIKSAVMFVGVGDYLKYALYKNYINKEDLYTTDREVLAKIEKYLSTDAHLQLLFDRMNNKVKFSNNPDDYEAHIFCKSRAVDPLFVDGKMLKRVSDVDEKFRDIFTKEARPKEYFVHFDR